MWLVIEQLREVHSNGRTDLVREIFTPDAAVLLPQTGMVLSGWDEIEQAYDQANAHAPTLEVAHVYEDEGAVWVLYSARIHAPVDEGGPQERTQSRYATKIRLHGNRIDRVVEYAIPITSVVKAPVHRLSPPRPAQVPDPWGPRQWSWPEKLGFILGLLAAL